MEKRPVSITSGGRISMLLVLSAFSKSKPQSAFVNQYALKEKHWNLSRGEIIFKVKGQWWIMGNGRFSFYSKCPCVLCPWSQELGTWTAQWRNNGPVIPRQMACPWKLLQWRDSWFSFNFFQSFYIDFSTVIYYWVSQKVHLVFPTRWLQ